MFPYELVRIEDQVPSVKAVDSPGLHCVEDIVLMLHHPHVQDDWTSSVALSWTLIEHSEASH